MTTVHRWRSLLGIVVGIVIGMPETFITDHYSTRAEVLPGIGEEPRREYARGEWFVIA